MKIQKRDGQLQEFEGEKIAQAIRKAFRSTGTLIEEAVLKEIIEDITKAAAADKPMLSVEVVQDLVEEELMQHQFYKETIFCIVRSERNPGRWYRILSMHCKRKTFTAYWRIFSSVIRMRAMICVICS